MKDFHRFRNFCTRSWPLPGGESVPHAFIFVEFDDFHILPHSGEDLRLIFGVFSAQGKIVHLKEIVNVFSKNFDTSVS